MCEGRVGKRTVLWVEIYVSTDMVLNPPLVFSLMQLAMRWKWYSSIYKAEILFKMLFLRANKNAKSKDIQEQLCSI